MQWQGFPESDVTRRVRVPVLLVLSYLVLLRLVQLQFEGLLQLIPYFLR